MTPNLSRARADGDVLTGRRPYFLTSIVRRLLATPIRLSLLGFKKSAHGAVPFSMYEVLCRDVPRFIDGTPSALAISGSGTLTKLVAPGAVVTAADYPHYNILSLPFPDNSFDLVVSDQVLEHVEGDPFLAVEECRRVLKPGGIVIHTAPLLIQIHGYPSDFWRFTPDGLALLCQRHTEVLLSGGWGNRYLWLLNWLGVLFEQRVPLASWHPYHRIAVLNETNFPVTCWVVARK